MEIVVMQLTCTCDVRNLICIQFDMHVIEHSRMRVCLAVRTLVGMRSHNSKFMVQGMRSHPSNFHPFIL